MRWLRFLFLPSSYFGIFQVLFLQNYHQSFRRLPTTRHDFWAMLQGENRDIKVESKNTYAHIYNRNKIMQKFLRNLPPITSQVSIKVEPSLKASNTPKIRLSVTSLDPSLCTVLETTSPFSLRITEDWGGTTEKLDYERSKLVVIMKQSKSNNW